MRLRVHWRIGEHKRGARSDERANIREKFGRNRNTFRELWNIRGAADESVFHMLSRSVFILLRLARPTSHTENRDDWCRC